MNTPSIEAAWRAPELRGRHVALEPLRLAHVPAQQVDLAARVIADAEVPHLAAGVQRIERARHFIRLHQRIGAVQQQDIQMVHAQARQAAFDRGHDMRVAEVVALRCARRIVGEADAALRLQDHLRAEPGRGAQHIAEHLFGLAARIDVGVVEQGDAVGQRRFDQPLRVAAFLRRDRRGIPGAAQVHAAVADAGNRQVIGQAIALHGVVGQGEGRIMPEPRARPVANGGERDALSVRRRRSCRRIRPRTA